jgi:recombination associated protein RdgC
MWFTNAIFYDYELEGEIDFTENLSVEAIKPCPPHARFIYGFMPVVNEALVLEVAGALLFCLGKEERVLPRAVITKLLEERVQAIEIQEDRRIKRSERAQMAEDLEFELLPKSFCIHKKIHAFLDTNSKRLIINTASENQATQLIASLKKAIPGFQVQPVFFPENLSIRFAEWIANPALLPASFQLASDCSLFSLNDEKKRITCRGYELPAEEIEALLSQGLAAAELSLIWNERIQFTLTQDLIFKRIKTHDYLIDELNEISKLEEDYLQRGAELTLLAGELKGLISDLFTGLESKAPAAQAAAMETCE